MIERLMRLDGEDDARVMARLIGRLVEDPNLRGWAALRSKPSERTFHVVREALHRSRVLLLSGTKGFALVGDPFSLFSAGRELAALASPEVHAIGVWLQRSAESVDGAPEPLAIGAATFDWKRPAVMGIVNVTPDSFSDGGRFLDAETAIAHGLRLAEEGADILDVGGESTRPRGKTYGEGAQTVADEEEIRRVVPVIQGLRARTQVPISIDTRKAAVARAALEAGATMVNDVSGLLHDPALADVVADGGAALCLMHTPADIEELSHEKGSDDIVGDVLDGLQRALDRAKRVDPRRIVLDPGIGFGKSAAHNLYLLRHLECFAALGFPLLVGASRKASIARAASATGEPLPVGERTPASLAAALAAVGRGAQVVRVHDVRESVQALRVYQAIRSASDAGAALSDAS